MSKKDQYTSAQKKELKKQNHVAYLRRKNKQKEKEAIKLVNPAVVSIEINGTNNVNLETATLDNKGDNKFNNQFNNKFNNKGDNKFNNKFNNNFVNNRSMNSGKQHEKNFKKSAPKVQELTRKNIRKTVETLKDEYLFYKNNYIINGVRHYTVQDFSKKHFSIIKKVSKVLFRDEELRTAISVSRDILKKIDIKVKQNNICCTLVGLKGNESRVLVTGWSGHYGIQTSKKKLKESCIAVVARFLKIIRKKNIKNFNNTLFRVLAPIKIRKALCLFLQSKLYEERDKLMTKARGLFTAREQAIKRLKQIKQKDEKKRTLKDKEKLLELRMILNKDMEDVYARSNVVIEVVNKLSFNGCKARKPLSKKRRSQRIFK
jgi:hypothetical protein